MCAKELLKKLIRAVRIAYSMVLLHFCDLGGKKVEGRYGFAFNFEIGFLD